MRRTVSIIIPNYNGEELLKKNLPSVIKSAGYYGLDSDTKVEVIIVDDCSSDNSNKIICNIKSQNYLHTKIIFLENSQNKGFSSTVNKGVKAATGEIVVLLNTDAYPDDPRRFIKSFIDLFEKENLFAVGFMDKSIEEYGRVVLRGRGTGFWSKGFLHHRKGGVEDKIDTLWVSGGSSAFRRSFWEKLHGMNEIYNPFYWEDIDLSYRAQKSGYEILFYKKCIVVHEHSKGAIKSSRSESEIKKISYRNQIYFAWLNMTDRNLIFTHILYMPLHIIRAILTRDWQFIAGLYLAINNIFTVVKLRSYYSREYIRTDQNIINRFSVNGKSE